MNTENNGCGWLLCGCVFLTVAFIVLKLCRVIMWPWIWIFSPLWILFDVFVAVLIIALLLLAVYYFAKTIGEKKK